MEAVVFCGIAGLVAFSVAGLLPAGAAPSRTRGSSAGVLGSLLLSIGAALDRVPRLVDVLAGLVLPLRDVEPARRLFFGRFDAGGKQLAGSSDNRRAAAVIALLVGAGAAAGGLASLSLAGAAVGAGIPVAVLAVAGERAKRATARDVERAMPEAFGALSIALGSGHSLSQAMRYVGVHSREPIRSEFMRVGFAIDCGFSATESLDGLIRRLHAPGLDMVALALKVSQRTGAPLKDLLAQAAKLVQDRIELQRTLDVKTSQARMSAHLVAGMPVAMIVLLVMLSSDFRKGVATVSGAFCVLLALGLNAVAWMVIRKIMRVEL